MKIKTTRSNSTRSNSTSPSERIALRDEDIERINGDAHIEERVKNEKMKAMRMESIAEVLEEAEVIVDTHFFNEFSETKSSMFLKRVISNQGSVEMRLLKKTWRTLNCSPKTMKIIREIQENLLCVGKRTDNEEEDRVEMLVQQIGAAAQRQSYHKLL